MIPHTLKTTRRFTGRMLPCIAALAGSCLSAAAQTAPPMANHVQQALSRQKLPEAILAARSAVQTSPRSAVAPQVLGILLMAAGRVEEAAHAFADAVRRDQRLPPTLTGLEAEYYPGSALYQGLSRQKVTIDLTAGVAAARSNLGAAKILLDRASGGQADLDIALSAQPNSGIVWANAAVADLERGKPKEADEAARKALDLGETTAKVYTSLADAAFRQGHFDTAQEYLRHAADRDANYPYALFLRSQLERKLLQPRDAERALSQALALDPSVASEGRAVPDRSELDFGGGQQKANRFHFLSDGQPGASYRVQADQVGKRLDSREHSYQQQSYFQAIIGQSNPISSGTLFASLEREAGDRPGPQGVSVHPNATFGFNRLKLAYLQRLTLGPARLRLHFGYAHDDQTLQTTPFSPAFHPLHDTQAVAEARIDTNLSRRDSLALGLSFLHNVRERQKEPAGSGLSSASPFRGVLEPNEQILPDGTTEMVTAFGFARHQIRPDLGLTLGPVFAWRSGTALVLPYLDLHLSLTPTRTLSLGILPRVMNANSDFYPLSALPSSAQADPQTTPGYETSEYNRNPILPGPNGRKISYEATLSQVNPKGGLLSVTGFHRQYRDVYNLVSDPRFSAYLPVDPISKAETTGLEVFVSQPLGGFALSSFSRFQKSHASPNPSLFPAGANSKDGCLGYYPVVETHLRLDLPLIARCRVSLEGFYVGKRTARIASLKQIREGTVGLTETATVLAASTNANITLQSELSSSLSLSITAYQIFGHSSAFYQGAPATPLFTADLTRRF